MRSSLERVSDAFLVKVLTDRVPSRGLRGVSSVEGVAPGGVCFAAMDRPWMSHPMVAAYDGRALSLWRCSEEAITWFLFVGTGRFGTVVTRRSRPV